MFALGRRQGCGVLQQVAYLIQSWACLGKGGSACNLRSVQPVRKKINEWYVLQYMKIEAYLDGFDLVDLENIQVPILDKSVHTPDV